MVKKKRFIKKTEWRRTSNDGEELTYKDLLIFLVIGIIPLLNILILLYFIFGGGRTIYYEEI
jgi:hypothetical protein